MGQHRQYRLGNITDINRLNFVFTAANHRQARRHHRHAGKAIKEAIASAKDQRWTQNHRFREFSHQPLFALGFGAGIDAG